MVRKIESLAADAATLHAYLREIATYPELTPDDEQQLGRQIRQDGSEEAVGRLVQGHLRFVAAYVRRFRFLGVPLLELIHEGNLGLIEAARRYDPASPGAFRAHAAWWVRQAVMHLLAESPRVSDVSAAGLMASTVHGRHVEALRLSVTNAQRPVGGDEGTDQPQPVLPVRAGKKLRRQAAAARIDAGTLHALRQHSVLRTYLN